jgi:hypothetical protein
MDTTAESRQAVSFLGDVARTPDGRFEGQIRAGATNSWLSFSGVLELLKVLEELLDAAPASDPPSTSESTDTPGETS